MRQKRAFNVLVAILNALSGWLLLLPFLGLIPHLSLPILYGLIFSNPLTAFLIWYAHNLETPGYKATFLYWAGKTAVLSVYAVFFFRLFIPLYASLLSLRLRWLFLNPVLHGLTTIAVALNFKGFMNLLSPTFWKPFGGPPQVDLTPGDFLVSGLAYTALGAVHIWSSLKIAKEERRLAALSEEEKRRAPEAPPQESKPAAQKEPSLAAGEGNLPKEVASNGKPASFPPPDPKPRVMNRKRRLEILRRALEGAELEEGLDLERVVELSAHLSEAALDERVRLARFKAEAMGKPVTWELLKRTLKKE